MLAEKVLITGCGGDIGLSLGRIARESEMAGELIGSDIQLRHAGALVFDQIEVLPPASSPGYLDQLNELVGRRRPDLIVPTSEAELVALLNAGFCKDFGGIPLLLANRKSLETGLDKLKTARTLHEAGIGTPWTRVVGEEAPLELPCIIKQRRGQGSKGLALAETWSVSHFTETRAGDLWQEYLPDQNQEYTCGLYGMRNGDFRTINFRRTLQGGLTSFGEVVQNGAIDECLAAVASILELRGPINVQLRMRDGRPFIFEINPRFSSTVGFRHKLGFRDFVWGATEALGGVVEDYIPPAPGTSFYRIGQELILAPDA